MFRFSQTLQDIFYISRVIGTFPFDHTFHISYNPLIYCSIIRLVVLYLQYIFRQPSGQDDVCHVVLQSFQGLHTALSLVGNILCIIGWLRKRKSVNKLVKNINKHLNDIPNVRFKKNQVRCSHFFFVSYSISVIVCYIYGHPHSWENIQDYVNSYIAYCYTISFISQFWELLQLLQYMLHGSQQLARGASFSLYRCFNSLQELDNGIYNPIICISITQYFIQVIKCIVIFLFIQPLVERMNNTDIILWLINNIILLVTTTCSYGIAKSQADKLNNQLVKKISELTRSSYKKSKKVDDSLDMDEILKGAFFTLDSSMMIAIISLVATCWFTSI